MRNANRVAAIVAATVAVTVVPLALAVADSLAPVPTVRVAAARTVPALHGTVGTATRTPCSAEDTVNCYWDAQRRGNGKGHSFYTVRVGHSTCVIYWNARYNRNNGKCYARTGR